MTLLKCYQSQIREFQRIEGELYATIGKYAPHVKPSEVYDFCHASEWTVPQVIEFLELMEEMPPKDIDPRSCLHLAYVAKYETYKDYEIKPVTIALEQGKCT